MKCHSEERSDVGILDGACTSRRQIHAVKQSKIATRPAAARNDKEG